MSNFVTSLILSAFIALSSYVAGAADAAASNVAQANNEFGFKLARELAKAQPGQNVCISPFSLASVLQLVRNGAAGETKSELDNVLETRGLSATKLAHSYAGLTRSLKSQSTNCILEIANAIWFAPNIRLNASFASSANEFFDARVAPLDFTDPRAAGMVNTWVTEKTHGRISQLLEGSISGDTSALVLNTAYFKGQWTTPFDPARTLGRPFKPSSGGQKMTRMMENSGKFLYFADRDAQIVRLPYGDGRLGMFILLPAKESSPAELLKDLTSAKWADATGSKLKEQFGRIVLPLLKFEYAVELQETLVALGIRMAFGSRADFSGISSDGLFISRAMQKASIEMNEEGTTAAAASAVFMTKGERPQAFEFVGDRPFLFVICDRDTQTILFLGIVQGP
jgi:serine protease inhibitor